MANRRRSNRMYGRGINRRLAKIWRNRRFNGTGPSRGTLTRSGVNVLSRVPSGTQPRFGIAVAGTSTALSITVAGSDVTVNSATSAGGAATTTAAQAVAALRANAAASALMWASVDEHTASTTVVSAAALASLVPAP